MDITCPRSRVYAPIRRLCASFVPEREREKKSILSTSTTRLDANDRIESRLDEDGEHRRRRSMVETTITRHRYSDRSSHEYGLRLVQRIQRVRRSKGRWCDSTRIHVHARRREIGVGKRKKSLLDLSKISNRKKKKKRRNNSQNRQNQFEFGRCDRRHGGTAKEEVSRAGSAFHD